MSDQSDSSDSTGDDAWDDASNGEASGRSEKRASGDEHKVDTLPPPPSGDAYSADTVIRDVPREALEAIREKKRLAASSEPILAADDKPSAETKVAAPPKELADMAVPESQKTTAKMKSIPPEALESESEPPAPKEPVERFVRRPPSATRYHGPAPVTPGELLTALAGAVVGIVAGFYLVSGFF